MKLDGESLAFYSSVFVSGISTLDSYLVNGITLDRNVAFYSGYFTMGVVIWAVLFITIVLWIRYISSIIRR